MKNMNLCKFSVFVLKKNNHNKLRKKIFVEKKYYKFHSYFFTWQLLTKYIFSSIYKHPQASNFFEV